MIHVRKDGVGAVEGGWERGMRGDMEGAFPIPSLPLKGNKELSNTRQHLWTHSLCGFWVSPLPLGRQRGWRARWCSCVGRGDARVCAGARRAGICPWPWLLWQRMMLGGNPGSGRAGVGEACAGTCFLQSLESCTLSQIK